MSASALLCCSRFVSISLSIESLKAISAAVSVSLFTFCASKSAISFEKRFSCIFFSFSIPSCINSRLASIVSRCICCVCSARRFSAAMRSSSLRFASSSAFFAALSASDVSAGMTAPPPPPPPSPPPSPPSPSSSGAGSFNNA